MFGPFLVKERKSPFKCYDGLFFSQTELTKAFEEMDHEIIRFSYKTL